jgi:hypothetical protein
MRLLVLIILGSPFTPQWNEAKDIPKNPVHNVESNLPILRSDCNL